MRALAGQGKQLGEAHPNLDTLTLGSVNNIAVLYERQGGFDEAKSLCARALAGRKQQLGADHRSTET